MVKNNNVNENIKINLANNPNLKDRNSVRHGANKIRMLIE